MSKIILGYWNIRGRGQIPRQLLSFTNTPFQERLYTMQTATEWFGNDKINLGFDYPNLPYLIEGDFKLTQTKAIIEYIIARSGNKDLLGRTVEDQGQVSNLIGVIEDLRKPIVEAIFSPKRQQIKNEIYEKSLVKLALLRDFIGRNTTALGYVTLADFYLSDLASRIEVLYPNRTVQNIFLFRIRHHLRNLPSISAYYSRPGAIDKEILPSFVDLKITPQRVKLGYWDLRGLAQVPRLLLSYYGVDFEDIRYTDPQQWFENDKNNLGIQFPNLPYLIDGTVTLTNNNAIQKYIIRKWGHQDLLGKTAQDKARVDCFNAVFDEIAGAVRMLFFNKDHETAKKAIFQKYKGKFDELQKFVGNKDFVIGYLTVSDFIVAQYSHYIQRLYPEQYSKYSFLGRIRANLNKLPQVVDYYARQQSFHGRFFPDFAALSIQK